MLDRENSLGQQLEDDFFDDALDVMERRRDLELAQQRGTAIEKDIAAKGPLFAYMQGRRRQALDDLQGLAIVDPADGIAVARLQASLKEYLSVCDFIGRGLEDAEHAARTIKQDFSNDQQEGHAETHHDD